MTTPNSNADADRKEPYNFGHRPIFDGAATIYQTIKSGGNWQVRGYLPHEKRDVRQSLRTKNLETAIQRAQDFYLEVRANVNAGRKIYGITLQELFDQYIEHRERDVRKGVIGSGRLRTIRTHLVHLLEFLSPRTKLTELDYMAGYEYGDFRFAENVSPVTVRNEQATINALIKWGYKRGYCQFQSFEFDKFRVDPDGGRRGTLTEEEFEQALEFLDGWVVAERVPTSILRERQLIREYFLILSETCLRTGEADQLIWSDVISTNYGQGKARKRRGAAVLPGLGDEDGRPIVFRDRQFVFIRVRPETSKKRKERDVVTYGGLYFERLSKLYADPKATQPVFADPSNSSRTISKRKKYDYWREIMEAIGVDYKTRLVHWYSLRHYGITQYLYYGADIWDVATIAGTSVEFIQKHYGHASHKLMMKAAEKIEEGTREERLKRLKKAASVRQAKVPKPDG